VSEPQKTEDTADEKTDNKPTGPYHLTVDLNVLNHLGFSLYSNVPAVLSEVIANCWDADAEIVTITLDRKKGTVNVEDDGVGMNLDDINERYLKVGYQKRKELTVTDKGRHVMGRKGIGKLSLFSIAKNIEVHSAKQTGAGVEKHGFTIERNPDPEEDR
jgi:DNA topoisomerase VI subunit B